MILEDYVQAPNGLTKVFTDAGLMKYWFPLKNMPKNGQDWPLISDMVANNQRLLVFTSIRSKEESEGIAYQWNYMVENQCKKRSLIYIFNLKFFFLYHYVTFGLRGYRYSSITGSFNGLVVVYY